MATVIYIRESKQSVSAMRGVMNYCQREDKVHDHVTERILISGVNCDGQNALTEFMMTKESYGKKDGMNFYQYVQSFESWDEISAADAHEIALEFAAKAWPGHEVLVCTHCDTNNPHSHFVINSVSFEDGHKLRQSPNTLKQLRQISDEICQAHGYEILKSYDGEDTNLSSREYRAAAKGESWKFRLMATIDDAMNECGSQDEFIWAMRRRGYDLTWTPERKYITFQCPNGKRCRDVKLHDSKYRKENMDLEFTIRKQTAEKLLAGVPHKSKRHRRRYDREDTVSGRGLRYPNSTASGGAQSAQGSGTVPAGDLSEDSAPGNERGAEDIRLGDTGYRGEVYESDGSLSDGDKSENSISPPAEHRTGWESSREIYLRLLRGAHLTNTGARHNDRQAEKSNHPYSNLDSGLVGNALGLGVAAAVAAAGLMGGEDEDEEERRRRYEAEMAAENFGAVLGLVGGLIAGGFKHNESEENTPEEEENFEGPIMDM